MLEVFKLIDILLISEIAWIVIFVGHQTLERTLFYVGALVSSGYVASISSQWITGVLLGHAATTMAWLSKQIQVPAKPVGLIGTVLPPESALSGHAIDSHWIAVHITTALIAIFVTIAVFLLFVVVSQLVVALWDLPTSYARGLKGFISYSCSFICGLYVAFLTGDTLANLSWIRLFSPISGQVTHSILLDFASSGISLLRLYLP